MLKSNIFTAVQNTQNKERIQSSCLCGCRWVISGTVLFLSTVTVFTLTLPRDAGGSEHVLGQLWDLLFSLRLHCGLVWHQDKRGSEEEAEGVVQEV